MDWSSSYAVSRSLALEISPAGKLLGVGSISDRPQEMDLDALPVLLGFASGSSPREVLTELQKTWEIEEAGFEAAVGVMLERGFLIPAGLEGTQEGLHLPAEGFGSIFTHHSMLRDTLRVLTYSRAIERHCPGKTVAEIGCGTGILSLFAAKAGARKVVAIEESRISEVAAEMFAANGCSDRIELKVGNSRNVELDPPADLIIHEILGVDPFEESLLPVLVDARRRLLKPGGRFLPGRLEVCCLGVEREEHRTPGRLLQEAREFAGIYGLDFGPFVRALEAAGPRRDGPARMIEMRNVFDRRILSGECRLLDLDFHEDGLLERAGQPVTVPLRITAGGLLDGVALFFRAWFDEETFLTTSPMVPVTHWGWSVRRLSRPVRVEAGDELPLSAGIDNQLGRQTFRVDLA
ncbi:MAG TPA: 50S ribosomal protein L11 methyltransferase [Thermoanaerobaculia bacterium]|nr:50S ribosomal protein L11 methyltransferase [Thermoanaerobaculia bacterium]